MTDSPIACEIIAVGSELLLGQIVDTNSSWMGRELAAAGIPSHHQIKVGDNQARLVAAIQTAIDRSGAVILCGGLGPTQDDLTREAVAEALGVELEFSDALAERIRSMFSSRGWEMPENNLRQAHVPAGGEAIPVQPGTAPGLVVPTPTGGVVYAVPGVPYEMQSMMTGFVLDDLRRRAGIGGTIRSRTLRTWGHSESRLSELLADRIDELEAAGNPTLAFLASGIEGLKVRITAAGEDARAATALLDAEEPVVRSIIGDVVFGTDDDTMESVVLGLLAEQGLTLSLAESLTGGMLGARLTAVPGASQVLRGGIIAYDPAVKVAELATSPEAPVVSREAAEAMAAGAAARFGTDVSIALTGVAGPGPAGGVEAGTVWMSWSIRGEIGSLEARLPGDRERVRQYSVITVLDQVRRALLAQT